MRPVFCGNIGYDTRHSDLERLFGSYGRVDRVDIKSGFAFIYFEDERDAEDAIYGLDNRPFGHGKRRLSVEWARHAGRGPRLRDGSRSVVNTRPTKTLFVINFDPINTRIHDIQRHFELYGNVLNVRIRRNFAFVQFETQEEATKALEFTNMSKILDRVVSVEYAFRDDGDRNGRGNPPSPLFRSRPSPDYGRDRSPIYEKNNGVAYDRNHSPEYGRYRSRSPLRTATRRSRS